MSTPAETSEDAAPTAKQQVDDEDNKSQNATIQRIQSFRDDIYEYQLFFAQNKLTGEVSEEQQHRSYHQLVKSFLQLLKPYLVDDEIACEKDYWEGVDLGTVRVEPPQAIQQPSRGQMQHALKAGDRRTLSRSSPQNTPDAKPYSVTGLKDFAASQAEWDVEWQVMFGPDVRPEELLSEIEDPKVDIHRGGHRTEPMRVVKRVQLPRHIIDNAVCEMETFIRELGMDIEMKADPYEGEGGAGL